MSQPNDYTITKAIVFFATEKALREINDRVFEKVTEILEKKYKCYLHDCYEYPEYLNEILKDYFGNSFVSITDNIKKYLSEYSDRTQVNEFLKVVCNV